MKKLILTYFLFALINPAMLMAQQNNSTDSTIRIVFGSKEKNQTSIKKKRKKIGEDNIIKIAPLGFVSGAIPVYYEKVINDFFTVQGGIGITSRNYIRSAFQEAGESGIQIKYPWGDDFQFTDQADAPLTFENRIAKTGFAFSVEPRLYFDSETPDGSYFGVSYNFYRYNFNIPGIIYNSTTGSYSHNGDIKKEHENIGDLMAVFGYHDIYDRLTTDYSVGFGIRNVSGIKYYYGSNSIDPAQEGIAPYKQNIFNVNIGLKIGYHF
jgi:hypothetical protein